MGAHIRDCLLYTSDAADERSSVDLGGRRIIKKKKMLQLGSREQAEKKTIWKETQGRCKQTSAR